MVQKLKGKHGLGELLRKFHIVKGNDPGVSANHFYKAHAADERKRQIIMRDHPKSQGFLDNSTIQYCLSLASAMIFTSTLTYAVGAYTITKKPELFSKIATPIVQTAEKASNSAENVLVEVEEKINESPELKSVIAKTKEKVEGLENILKNNIVKEDAKETIPSSHVAKPVLGKTSINLESDGEYTFKTKVANPSIDSKVSLIIDSNGDGIYSRDEIERGRDLKIVDGYAILSDIDVAKDKIANVLKNSYIKLKGKTAQSAKGISMFAKNYMNLFAKKKEGISPIGKEKTYFARVNSSMTNNGLKDVLLGSSQDVWKWKDRAKELNRMVDENNYDSSTLRSLKENLYSNKTYLSHLSKETGSVLELDKKLQQI
ncbi:hypothetical protein C0585_07460 [Candidatus Woesearchaeota archaeon]|nr:MAG: hypothetical protein C0585_07460 [Candidatus Woesearchaeota archaeon]